MQIQFPALIKACIGLTLIAQRCAASEMPSYSFEDSAWNATDIVIVSHDEQGLRVIETWKGSLETGSLVDIAGLPAAPLQVRNWDKSVPPTTVDDQRVVLFLKPAKKTEGTAGPIWTGTARFGGINVSAVWIGDGKTYAFRQLENPGPLELSPLNQDEQIFKQRTINLLSAKGALAAALKVGELSTRVELLRPMCTGPYWYQRKEAIDALGDCGAAAVPAMRQMLKENSPNNGDIVKALARAAGDNASTEITSILKAEVEFWRAEAPALPVGWWNNLQPDDKRQSLHNRYGILQPALSSIVAAKDHSAEDAVRQLRDLWVSLPQLDDPAGLNQITEECNATLRALAESEVEHK